MDPSQNSQDTRVSKPPSASASTSNAQARQPALIPQPQISTPPPSMPLAPSSKPARRPSTSAGSSSGKAIDKHTQSLKTSSNASLKQKKSKKLDEAPTMIKEQELLKSYTADFKDLQNIITCKICDRFLYEPYVIACGHIYCYSCLSHWFGNNKKRKTCPDCRAIVTQVPAPAYLIRDMTTIFIKRVEHLPAGETVEQHTAWRQEEADLVQKDRDNTDPKTGGLFKGVFKQRIPQRFVREAILDYEDNVERCPRCAWELEDGECTSCGYVWNEMDPMDSFSDLDESELGGSSEDMDGDIDIGDYEEGDFPNEEDWDGIDGFMGEPYAIRRFLGNARGAALHSAGAGRPRYSGSIVSGMFSEDHEMEPLEEEDEEDDEDSSMNDFIDDDAGTEHGSDRSSSIYSQTPIPLGGGENGLPDSRRQQQTGRHRRVIDSESPSVSRTSQNDEDDDDDEDEEEGGPIRPGQRRRQQRALARANGLSRATSSTSTEASQGNELDEDTQHLLHRHGWSPLTQDGPDEDMGGEEDGDSDGARTTVGWEPTAIANTRPRMTDSLTPLADSPTLQNLPRPRAGQPRFVDGSRGLRRRSSVLTVSTANYEDGEADDDDSEIDRDGDTSMQGNQLRVRRSQIRLRNIGQSPSFRPPSRALGDGIDGTVDSDENSDDTSIQSPRRRYPNSAASNREYDPRISRMFAQHQNAMFATSAANPLTWLEQELRPQTPIARPRTANRNRLSQSTTPSPFSPLTNNMNPLASPIHASPRARRMHSEREQSQNSAIESTNSSGRSHSINSSLPGSNRSGTETGIQSGRESSVESTGSNSTIVPLSRPSMASMSDRPASRNSANSISQSLTSGPSDIIERPASRLPGRPPSANSRRGSQGLIGNFATLPMSPGLGLNFAARTWQQQTRNPYQAFIQGPGFVPRQRASRQQLRDAAQLREQPSNATLRPANSRRNLRPQPSRGDVRDENAGRPVMMRPQNSQVNLRTRQSRQRLQAQPSVRVLRQNDHGSRQASGNGAHVQPQTGSTASSLLMMDDERQRRVYELLQNRSSTLLGNSTAQSTNHTNNHSTNPFHSSGRRPSVSNESVRSSHNGVYASNRNPENLRSSAEPNNSTFNGQMSQSSSTSSHPSINRRRSNRQMGLPPGVLPATNSTSSATGHTRNRSGGSSGSGVIVQHSRGEDMLPTLRNPQRVPIASGLTG